MVNEPTHLEGNLLYHTYLHDAGRVNDYSIELQSKYFTDHKGIAIVVINSGSIKESDERTIRKVNQMNNQRLKILNGEEKVIVAICIHKIKKNSACSCKDHLLYWGFGDGGHKVGLEMMER